MGLDFNAEEILEIACQIERNGARFYRRAAKIVKDPEVVEVLRGLAAMEDNHEITFETMRGDPDLLSMLLGDEEGPAVLYLRALAGGRIFPKSTDPAAELGEENTVEEILGRAIELELKSIAFYEGVRQQIPLERGREKIDAIIREEMGHVALLSGRLEKAAR